MPRRARCCPRHGLCGWATPRKRASPRPARTWCCSPPSSRRCWTMPSSSAWPTPCGAGSNPAAPCSGTTSPSTTRATRRARRAAGPRAPALSAGDTSCAPRHLGAALGERVVRLHPGLYGLFNTCRCCAAICWPGWAKPGRDNGAWLTHPHASPSCPLPCPRSAKTRSPKWWTRCVRAGSPRAQGAPLRGGLHGLPGRPVAALDRRQLGHRRTAPGAGSPGHRPRRRGHHHHPHLHRHRRGGALPGRRRQAGGHRPGHAVHRPRAGAAAITPRTKAIMPVHYAGLAADMPAVLAIAGATA
jgi:hypothetical protein